MPRKLARTNATGTNELFLLNMVFPSPNRLTVFAGQCTGAATCPEGTVMHRARSPHVRAASVPRSYMGGFGRYLLRESVIDKPGLLLWFPGSSKHITRRQFLILGDAGFRTVSYTHLRAHETD